MGAASFGNAEYQPREVDTMIWTDEQITILKIMWGNGKTASEIAQTIGSGVTRNSVIGKSHRLGLSGRPSPIRNSTSCDLKLSMLTERMCRWPFGDPKKTGFHFCGRPSEFPVPYCAEHRALAYQAARKPIVMPRR